jgi:hypothetical protein
LPFVVESMGEPSDGDPSPHKRQRRAGSRAHRGRKPVLPNA